MDASRVSAEAEAAAQRLEDAVSHLETFEQYAPKDHAAGLDLVGGFTQRMHPMRSPIPYFREGYRLDRAQRMLVALQQNLDNRVYKDKTRIQDLSRAAEPEGEEWQMVNRWQFFEDTLRARDDQDLLLDYFRTMAEIKSSLEALAHFLQ